MQTLVRVRVPVHLDKKDSLRNYGAIRYCNVVHKPVPVYNWYWPEARKLFADGIYKKYAQWNDIQTLRLTLSTKMNESSPIRALYYAIPPWQNECAFHSRLKRTPFCAYPGPVPEIVGYVFGAAGVMFQLTFMVGVVRFTLFYVVSFMWYSLL